ncbi:hypothetical protein EJA71_09145 [Pseudomonas sp. PB106]|nr:hypothetical protein EJA71_09145 [Pseudomonas sp. PB106]
MIVPTLRVGMQPWSSASDWNAERPLRHSHAERGNDQNPVAAFGSSYMSYFFIIEVKRSDSRKRSSQACKRT